MADTLRAGQTLEVGHSLYAASRPVVLDMQGDGNLVLYRIDSRPSALWSTATWGRPVQHAVMQADGNFVLYDPAGHAMWSSGTWNHPGAYLVLQDDGNLVVYDMWHRALWASGTVQDWRPAPVSTAGPVLEAVGGVPSPPSSSLTWSSDLVGGRTWMANDPPPLAWTQVLDPATETDSPVVGASGRVIDPQVSSSDFWFHHPFGNDWECFIELDPPFQNLLSPHNDGSTGDQGNDYQQATAQAPTAPRSGQHTGVLGVEYEAAFIPVPFRARPGDRIATFGRWIVDDGHDDFHTEIHPPLLVVSGRGTSPTLTQVTLVGRPYLVSQSWPEGSFRAHMVAELTKAASVFGSQRIEAHPTVLARPFAEAPAMRFRLRTPTPAPADGAALTIAYGLTVRTGVSVTCEQVAADAVDLTVAFDSARYPTAALPPRADLSIDTSAVVEGGGSTAQTLFVLLQGLAWTIPVIGEVVGPHLSWVLSRGVLTDSYTLPAAWVPAVPTRLTTGPVGAVAGAGPLATRVDDSQPFPVFGAINLGWGPVPAGPLAVGVTYPTADGFSVQCTDSVTGAAVSGTVRVQGQQGGATGQVLPLPVQTWTRFVNPRLHEVTWVPHNPSVVVEATGYLPAPVTVHVVPTPSPGDV